MDTTPPAPPAPADAPLILVLHGPNLNLLGTREPHLYGRTTLAEIDASLREIGAAATPPLRVETRQSNHEGVLIDVIQQFGPAAVGIVINPGGLTHTSVALRDALVAIGRPTIEVHLSNVHAREEFRHRSFVAPIALAQIAGLGADGYRVALRHLIARVRDPQPEGTGR